jgi:hypothetical protein
VDNGPCDATLLGQVANCRAALSNLYMYPERSAVNVEALTVSRVPPQDGLVILSMSPVQSMLA